MSGQSLSGAACGPSGTQHKTFQIILLMALYTVVLEIVSHPQDSGLFIFPFAKKKNGKRSFNVAPSNSSVCLGTPWTADRPLMGLLGEKREPMAAPLCWMRKRAQLLSLLGAG